MTIIDYCRLLCNLLTNVCMLNWRFNEHSKLYIFFSMISCRTNVTDYQYQFKHFSKKNDVIFILCTSRMKVWVCRMNEKDGWDILVLERLEYFIYTLWRIPVV